jgi:ribosomal protein S18 acetylase RimI-like enzyme
MPICVRRELHPGDLGAIAAQHGRLYAAEYGHDATFEAMVASSVANPAARGWPDERERIWIVERGGELAGSLGLTDEGNDEARLRWFLLDPDLRGHGLGRRLLGELLAEARELGYERVTLETFSDLEAAARLYREHGFELVWSDTAPRWGRAEVTYQRYELDLAGARRVGGAEAVRSTPVG